MDEILTLVRGIAQRGEQYRESSIPVVAYTRPSPLLVAPLATSLLLLQYYRGERLLRLKQLLKVKVQ